MEEMIKDTALEQPNSEENTFSQEPTDTIPKEPNTDAFIEVKFNKETRKLSLEEASTLAQKGLKLDHISEELDILSALSKEKGVGLKEFVKGLKAESEKSRIDALCEKYSQDSELTGLLSTLKEKGENTEELELCAEIPSLVPADIPQEVKAAAAISGRGLLTEYLLYEYRQRCAAEGEAARQEKSRLESLGSVSAGSGQNPTDAEFLKGVWGN